MLVGYNGQFASDGTNTPAFSNAATLLIENGATLTDQSYGQIGAPPTGGQRHRPVRRRVEHPATGTNRQARR